MSEIADRPSAAPAATADMVPVPGGMFAMGSDEHYPEEAPVHRVHVDGFWMDRHAVTNERFAAFVEDTSYVSVAERPLDPTAFPGVPASRLAPGSLVFHKTSEPVDLDRMDLWWSWIPGASWRHPEGPSSSLDGREQLPVVQIAYEDAEAYAAWASVLLPTEAEWERAARGGLEGAEYAWGDEQLPDGVHLANWWQGLFPYRNGRRDGFDGVAPVGSFPANGFGLHEMTGNTWEWTSDWFTALHPPDAAKPCCVPENPRGGDVGASYDAAQPQVRVPRKVIKGGSFLCADIYCKRYRPAARRPQMVDSGMSHIGFRCVWRPAEAERD